MIDLLHLFVLAGGLAVLLAVGVPVAFALAAASLATLALSMPLEPAALTTAQRVATGLDSFALLAIPFFILAGQLMNRGGIARRLIDLARALVGGLPAGLAHVHVVGSMLFGAISGSAVASASAVGGVMAPHMARAGYDRRFTAALNISSATTGLIIPPSNILIVYSLAGGGVSIAALFVAGYLPGLLLGGALMGVAVLTARPAAAESTDAAGEAVSLGAAAWRALPSLMLLVVVIGGILAGIFTATEAAAVAVLYAGALAFAYREIGLADLPAILRDAASTTGVVTLLIGASMALSWVMAYENLPQALAEALLGITDSRVALLLLINLVLLSVGTFLDMTPAVLIFTPIFLPIVKALGMDPIHFGIVLVLNLCIGLCTPPVGTVLFVGCGVAELRITDVVGRLWPFYLAMVAVLLLVTFLPWLSLALPGLLGL